MRNNKLNHKQVILAAILASLITLAFGLTYHTLAMKLAAPVNNINIVPEVLEQLPMKIDDWMGKDIPMDEAVVRATGTDVHINRIYSHKNDMESISLFFGCSVSVYENAIHRPEICYTKTGWKLINRHSSELSLDKGVKLPYSIFQFSRGDLVKEESIVLHYYVVDGKYYEEVSLLQAKLWRLGGTADYIGRVMISAPIKFSSVETAEKLVSLFAVDSAPYIADLFNYMYKNQNVCSMDPLKDEENIQ